MNPNPEYFLCDDDLPTRMTKALLEAKDILNRVAPSFLPADVYCRMSEVHSRINSALRAIDAWQKQKIVDSFDKDDRNES